MFYYTYKITLLCGSLKNHYYLGKHSTKNLNDGYCGSGKILVNYFKRFPKKKGITYTKEIIDFFDTEEQVFKGEELLIGDKWKTDPLCLNMVPGGKGYYCEHDAWNKGLKGVMPEPWNKGKKLGTRSPETIQKIKDNLPERKGEDAPMFGKHHTEESRKAMSEGHIGGIPWNIGLIGVMPEPWNKGVQMTKETKEKCRESAKKLWETPEYRKKLSKAHIGQISARRKPVISTVVETGEEEYWDYIGQAASELGIKSHGNILFCISGKRKLCCKRTWRYA